MLSPERDEQLASMTEHRVTTCSHDLVPDYLRTKLEPLAEAKMVQLEHKAATLTYENAQVCNCFEQSCSVTQVWVVLETSSCISESSVARLGHC